MNDRNPGQVEWFRMSPLHSPADSPSRLSHVEIEVGARSRRSPLRVVNDDHYLVLRLGRQQHTLLTSLPPADVPESFNEYGYGLFIADGAGKAGEAASRLAISTLVHLIVHFGRWNVRINEPIADEVMDRAMRFYRGVDTALLRESRDNAQPLQTTLTAAFIAGTELFFAHVGHSRAYAFRDDQLMQLTHDHTLESHTRSPIVDLSSTARDLSSILTEVLGRSGSVGPRIDIERFGLLDGDVILLTTNGLTDVAADKQIANALRAYRTPDDQSRALVDLAVNSGTQDDVTVVVAHCHVFPRDDAEGPAPQDR